MKKFALILGIVSLVAACNTVEEPSNIQDQAAQKTNQVVNAPVLNASIEEAAETKSYLNESDWSILWTANDEISAFVQNTSNWEYKFAGATGDQSGAFNPVDAPEGGSALDYIYAVYPYSASNTIAANGVMTVNFPATQTYKAKSFGQGANTMVAVAADKESPLQFKNACGFLMLKLYGNDVDVKSVSLKGKNNEKIAGAATISMPLGGEPTVTMTSDATDEIKVKCSSSLTLGNSSSNYTEFWFAIPPVTFAEGFTITVTTSGGATFSKSTSSSFNIVRGQAKKMAPIEVKVPTYLSKLATANCYIVDVDNINPLGYYFDATVAGNGVANHATTIAGMGYSLYPSPAGSAALATGQNIRIFLNGDADGYGVQAQHPVISDVYYSDGKIFFTATGAKGNAKIQLRDAANDDPVWNWTIWCTDQPAEITIPTADGSKYYTILDRNLGAITSEPGYTEATFGLYYMFGCPIGFTVAEFSTANLSNTTMYYQLAYYTNTPFVGPSTNFAWFNQTAMSDQRWQKSVYGFLWGAFGTGAEAVFGATYAPRAGTNSVKTMYDPCPVGYKVMAYDVLDGRRYKTDYDANDDYGLYVNGTDGTAFFPYNGNVWNGGYTWMTHATEADDSSFMWLWTSKADSANMAYCHNTADYAGGSAGLTTHILSRGMGVRCMKQ